MGGILPEPAYPNLLEEYFVDMALESQVNCLCLIVSALFTSDRNPNRQPTRHTAHNQKSAEL